MGSGLRAGDAPGQPIEASSCHSEKIFNRGPSPSDRVGCLDASQQPPPSTALPAGFGREGRWKLESDMLSGHNTWLSCSFWGGVLKDASCTPKQVSTTRLSVNLTRPMLPYSASAMPCTATQGLRAALSFSYCFFVSWTEQAVLSTEQQFGPQQFFRS